MSDRTRGLFAGASCYGAYESSEFTPLYLIVRLKPGLDNLIRRQWEVFDLASTPNLTDVDTMAQIFDGIAQNESPEFPAAALVCLLNVSTVSLSGKMAYHASATVLDLHVHPVIDPHRTGYLDGRYSLMIAVESWWESRNPLPSPEVEADEQVEGSKEEGDAQATSYRAG